MTTPGSSSQALVELVDLFPTLADLCRVPRPTGLQGISFLAQARDPKLAGKSYAYTVVRRGQHLGKAIRTAQYRYARWPDGEELYDLTLDPAEHRNLANAPKFAQTLASLREQLTRVEAKITK